METVLAHSLKPRLCWNLTTWYLVSIRLMEAPLHSNMFMVLVSSELNLCVLSQWGRPEYESTAFSRFASLYASGGLKSVVFA
ncbi:hypothetical protein OGATHE_000704 [Ogataea polymorpha]|uniref:Uncharacterized protein n=1 Tax=Ogataea polymorpha TaxID=460523 RepID=A0A9P8TGL9_9ASCO|nr:hypothetical protein OGATHE_000704 [Ogataea polymorpha]